MTAPCAIIANDYPRLVIPLIEAAQHSIDLIVYDWRWYPSVQGSTISAFNDAILAAQRRGVQVRALVNGDGILALVRERGIDARRVHSHRTLHTKILIIDGSKVVIGSHNYTQNAFSLNHEASVLVEFSPSDNNFLLYFNNLWGV